VSGGGGLMVIWGGDGHDFSVISATPSPAFTTTHITIYDRIFKTLFVFYHF
jgi:hypothetical protein